MKNWFISLLVASLFIGIACNLACFTCTNQPTYDNCRVTTVCEDASIFCKTMITNMSTSAIRITKTCERACTDNTTNTKTVTCCGKDFCNEATNMKTSYPLLTLAAGVSAFLLRAAV
ncbi:ly6/PLAUR domain-containing protein 2-like [Lissotriton helveticus]